MDRRVSGEDEDLLLYAGRLARLDAKSLVRVEPGAVWSILPIQLLARRRMNTSCLPGIYQAGDFSEGIPAGPRADLRWLQRLPKEADVLEEVPARTLAEVDRAAGAALRERRGQGVGDRRLRDVMLDHVVITVDTGGRRYEVRQRLVTGLMRMGFLGPAAEGTVQVVGESPTGRRLGLRAPYGEVWELDRSLTLTPVRPSS
ncbi:hypothetical protein [Salininema proteolyticum]|uniref:DUF8185 domain-containing protein n=1 Tax=Salininema proteolyticum TaxID=1607685 RepID=A0ABV8U1R9_9ACTN